MDAKNQNKPVELSDEMPDMVTGGVTGQGIYTAEAAGVTTGAPGDNTLAHAQYRGYTIGAGPGIGLLTAGH